MNTPHRAWPELVALLALAVTWALSAWLTRPEPADGGPRLADLPLTLGAEWSGEVLDLDPRQRALLQATDLLLRDYRRTPLPSGSPTPPVTLLVAYYATQRTGATYHSPRHCLPGSGWQITSLATRQVPGPAGEAVRVNEVIIQQGLERQLLLYWYQDRGRILTSEYVAKAYLVWDALTKNRTDGTLIRVSVPVVGDVAGARAQADRFVEEAWGPLTALLTAKSRGGP